MRNSSLRAAALALAASLMITACSSDGEETDTTGSDPTTAPQATQLFPDDFAGVCSGATESRGADYSTSTAHKVVYFESHEDSLIDQSSRLPADWTVTFDANADTYAAVDVVGCGVRTAETLAKTCPGYDDEESDTSGTVNWHTGTYEMTAYEARTGKVLGSATIEASSDTCPMLATFDEGETEIDMYDSPPEEEVVKFLKPFVQP